MAIIKNNVSYNFNSAASGKFWLLVEKIKPYVKDRKLNIMLVVLLLISTMSALYFYSRYTTVKIDPQKIVQDERTALLAQVSRLIVLPTGEDPTLATVSNIDVLRAQPFFSNAKNGDRVLIYANAKKAILYDPDSDKIVEVAPIIIGLPQSSSIK